MRRTQMEGLLPVCIEGCTGDTDCRSVKLVVETGD